MNLAFFANFCLIVNSDILRTFGFCGVCMSSLLISMLSSFNWKTYWPIFLSLQSIPMMKMKKKYVSIIVWLYYEFYKFLQFLECEWKNFKWSNFLSLNVNVNSVVRSHRDGQISPFITQGTLYFPHSWLSSHGKNKFPHSLLRSSWGNLFSPFLLSHSWGKYNVPFVIHGKISFSPFVASPLKGKNPIPIPPNYGIKPLSKGLFGLGEGLFCLRVYYLIDSPTSAYIHCKCLQVNCRQTNFFLCWFYTIIL